MTAVDRTADVPVRITLIVKASAARAFRVFTKDIDSWWPRTHHIGKSPMRKVFIEGRVGGRCYTEQVDDTECDWGTVTVWEPHSRFVMAWQITGTHWEYEPDVAKSSEVEVRFTSMADGSTRVDLEHRHFDRLGETGAFMRAAVDSPNGWTGTMQLFATQAERAEWEET